MAVHAIMRNVVCLSLILVVAFGFPVGDEITNLPGWEGRLPSRQFSGFVNTTANGMTMHSHYWYVESENDPSTDPVLVWYQGGPGASSLFGLLVEMGPLVLNDDSLKGETYEKTGIPQLFYNEFGWQKFANILVFSLPPPVGFSFCDAEGPAGDGNSCGSWNDTLSADVNYELLNNWFHEAFPERLTNDLYISGESYAGVYVPMLADRMMNDNSQRRLDNFKGFAVGDGCAGTDVLCGNDDGPWFFVEFMHGHGQFSEPLYRQIMSVCGEAMLRSGDLSDDCSALLDRMGKQIGGYFSYNLYDDCIYEEGLADSRPTTTTPTTKSPHPSPFSSSSSSSNGLSTIRDARQAALPGHLRWWREFQIRTWGGPVEEVASGDARRVGAAVNDYVCGGMPAMVAYTAKSEVRAALHVPLDSNFFSGDNGVGFTYNITETTVLPVYREASARADVRVLIYDGDTDPGINSFATQDWTERIGLTETSEWSPWTMDGCLRMGGYVTEYEGDVNYLTIRGSGHMVPQFKPEFAQEFMRRWVSNHPLQTYDPKCTAPRRRPK